ncbi:hypothetical protein SCUP515_02984 [Seiridium cupressi]
MELYATGFNAWEQLNVDTRQVGEHRPADLYKFVKVFSDDRIVKVWASLSATKDIDAVNSGSGVHTAGCVEDWQETFLGLRLFSPTVAMTGAGRLAIYNKTSESIILYEHPDHYRSGKPMWSIKGLGSIIQIVGYETGFAALSAGGVVWTWGDERFPACLGRNLREPHSSKVPGTVKDLIGLPTGKITKIAAGGYLLMALTEKNDLYAWGGHPGLPAMFDGLSRSPAPIEIGDNDVVDFGIGTSHSVILTKHGELWAVGENTNGQLGLPEKKKVDSWTRVPFPPMPGKSISAVYCGPRSTLVVVRHNTIPA